MFSVHTAGGGGGGVTIRVNHMIIKCHRFQNLRFRDGLVWTVHVGVEIKLRFHISLV